MVSESKVAARVAADHADAQLETLLEFANEAAINSLFNPGEAARDVRAYIADLKREADRMRGALEKLDLLMKCRPHTGDDNAHYCPNCDNSLWAAKEVIRAALSHQADDAGAVTGSEERLREALRPFERFAEYLAGRPGVTLAGATVREETIMPDDEIATVGDASGFATIRARHFLDAAAALSEQQGGK